MFCQSSLNGIHTLKVFIIWYFLSVLFCLSIKGQLWRNPNAVWPTPASLHSPWHFNLYAVSPALLMITQSKGRVQRAISSPAVGVVFIVPVIALKWHAEEEVNEEYMKHLKAVNALKRCDKRALRVIKQERYIFHVLLRKVLYYERNLLRCTDKKTIV